MKHNNSSKNNFFPWKTLPPHTQIVRILNAHSLVTADKDTSFPSLLAKPENKCSNAVKERCLYTMDKVAWGKGKSRGGLVTLFVNIGLRDFIHFEYIMLLENLSFCSSFQSPGLTSQVSIVFV